MHEVQAFIIPAVDGLLAAVHGGSVQVIALSQGWGLMPISDALFDETPQTMEEYPAFWKLHGGLVRLAAEASGGRAFAYLETDYWGGSGTQAAAVWHGGALVFGPEKREGAINEALRMLGVSAIGHRDEFEAVGLHRHRSNDDWFAAASSEASDQAKR